MPPEDPIAELVDREWYLASYPDVRGLGTDPVEHFIRHGLADGRNPNGWFHRSWYQATYPDVTTCGLSPLLHYLRLGAAAGYNPHPRFDAAWYVREHPEAADNPLLFHMQVGQARGWDTEPLTAITDYLPSTAPPLPVPRDVAVDIVIPVQHGLAQTRRCIEAVLADPARPPGRIIVVDDHAAGTDLANWIDGLAAARRIERLRNRESRGVLASANHGIAAAGTHDVLLLSSAVVLPAGAIHRLAAHAYAGPRIASVSPLSSTATLCGYPGPEGGRLPAGLGPDELDQLCRMVNVGRSVEVPATTAVCMYLRREALHDVGPFDASGFAWAGGDVDFCCRSAAQGWRHVLACDTFVGLAEGMPRSDEEPHPLIADRHPDYSACITRHRVAMIGGPFRFAITASAFHRSGRPTILMIFHGLGGGARRHMMSLIDRFGEAANFLLLFATSRGVALTAPSFPGHPLFLATPDRVDDLVQLLRSCGLTRVHIHHLKGLAYDVSGLIRRLGVPFDLTVHDYFAICPQVNLLPWPDSPYCGEPGPAGCNACIASRPAEGATEILAWRRERAWQFLDAERVFCPSTDVRDRLARYGLDGRAIVVPHEPVAAGPWPLRPPKLRGRKLRIALLGVMANLKGAAAVAALAEQAAPAGLEIHVIGPVEGNFPERARQRVRIAGPYEEADLPRLLARVQPHVVWFPSPCPETYSYTLTTAIGAGLPIVATAIGSFPARLAGRPLTWIVDPGLSVTEWLAVFGDVREALCQPVHAAPVPERTPVDDYYARHYLEGASARRPGDLRRPGRSRVVVIPERLESGGPSRAAYVRLLQPLDRLSQDVPLDLVLAEPESALHYQADVIVTHRQAVPSVALADALARHARVTGATLVYDLNDDVRTFASGANGVVGRMLRAADRVVVPTPALGAGLRNVPADAVQILPDGLDERLWCDQLSPPASHAGIVRILLLGEPAADISLVMPALQRVKQEYGGWVSITFIGATGGGAIGSGAAGLPGWIEVPTLPTPARLSYPGFVRWLISQPGWDIGLAPLADHPINRNRPPLGALDYAALGLAILASEVPAYRGSVADGPGGQLVGCESGSWYASINWLIRNPSLRQRLAMGARGWFEASGTLAAQGSWRVAAWERWRAMA